MANPTRSVPSASMLAGGHEIGVEVQDLEPRHPPTGRRFSDPGLEGETALAIVQQQMNRGSEADQVKVAIEIDVREAKTGNRAMRRQRPGRPLEGRFRFELPLALPREQPQLRGIAAENHEVEQAISVEVLQRPAAVAANVESLEFDLGVAAEQFISEPPRRAVLAQEHQIVVAIAVQIAGQHQHGAAVRTGDPRRLGDLRELPVAVVVPKLVRSRAAHEQVQVAVMIRIQEQRGSPLGCGVQAGLGRDVQKRAVALAPQQSVAARSGHKQVGHAVIVEVTQRTAQNAIESLEFPNRRRPA